MPYVGQVVFQGKDYIFFCCFLCVWQGASIYYYKFNLLNKYNSILIDMWISFCFDGCDILAIPNETFLCTIRFI